ncbi:hypothetical protein HYFRA_00000213 [Hymenoscyphus fraxineus]|uniref:Uncharacterized protein n=1 Tax=Hymenoscyphus fraxineus TaxID=746836 RepID=A0A9N9L493_9HELO|nr:hypothetical protein HYFRA_00000213 [Hymenoscyphus fraxineus]
MANFPHNILTSLTVDNRFTIESPALNFLQPILDFLLNTHSTLYDSFLRNEMDGSTPRSHLLSPSANPGLAHSIYPSDPRIQSKYAVTYSDRSNYGIPGLILLASNHPISQMPSHLRKRVLTIGSTINGKPQNDSDWIDFFEKHLHGHILSFLERNIPVLRVFLNSVRVGYEQAFPIVVQISLVLDPNLPISFSQYEECAQGLASYIDGELSTNWHGEEIHVEISGRPYPEPEIDTNPSPKDSLGYNPEFYRYQAPLPYTSIEVTGGTEGTLGCYIKHIENGRIRIFALTCSHIVDRDTIFPYRYYPGSKILEVQSPSLSEVCDTQSEVSRILGPYYDEYFLDNYQATFNPWFGHIFATSGLQGHDWRLAGSEGASDWALIEVSESVSATFRNRHVPSSPQFAPFDSPLVDAKINTATREQARIYFSSGPDFKSVKTETAFRPNGLVLKPKTRMNQESTWGEMNPIKSTIIIPARGDCARSVGREWCCVGLGQEKGQRFCRAGDSGSVVLDQDFCPAGILWGSEVNMDITFVSPLPLIFRDVERKMGWAAGSVSLG